MSQTTAFAAPERRDRLLIKRAQALLEVRNATAAAVLRTTGGRSYPGVALVADGVEVPAELVALGAALAAGEAAFDVLVTVTRHGDDAELVAPCRAALTLLAEAAPDACALVPTPAGPRRAKATALRA